MTAPWRPTLVKGPEAAAPIPAAPAVDVERMAELLLEEAKRKADQLLTEAKASAEAMLAAAKQEAEKQRQAGYEIGKQTGFAAGEKAGKAKYQQEVQALEQARQRLVQKDLALIAEAEPEIVEIALLVAGRVIGQQLRSDDSAVQASLRQLLTKALGARSALLLVSPEDFEHLWAKRQDWSASIPGLREFSLEPSPSLQKGDLILQSNLGTIDARVETILNQVADQLGDGAIN